MIDTMPGWAWSTLPDGSTEFLNHSWSDHTGLPMEEGLRGGWKVRIHPDGLERGCCSHGSGSWLASVRNRYTIASGFEAKHEVSGRESLDGSGASTLQMADVGRANE